MSNIWHQGHSAEFQWSRSRLDFSHFCCTIAQNLMPGAHSHWLCREDGVRLNGKQKRKYTLLNLQSDCILKRAFSIPECDYDMMEVSLSCRTWPNAQSAVTRTNVCFLFTFSSPWRRQPHEESEQLSGCVNQTAEVTGKQFNSTLPLLFCQTGA